MFITLKRPSDYGANPRAVCDIGCTPLSWAIHSDNPDIYVLLIEADPGCIWNLDRRGGMVLHRPAELTSLELVEYYSTTVERTRL